MSSLSQAPIEIRPVRSLKECDDFAVLEQMVWQAPPIDALPSHLTWTAIKNGGGLIAAFSPDGPAETGGMVGATFWFLGVDQATISGAPGPLHVKACSQVAGVLPAWQGQRIGERLKWAQRDAVLAQGVTDHISWTYDPLLQPNALLNIHKLGAICNTYFPNHYGDMQDGLNKGMPSDRLQVDWWLKSPRVLERAAGRVAPALLPDEVRLAGHLRSDGLRAPGAVKIPEDGRPLAVPLPTDLAVWRRYDPALALAWRLFVREALQSAFAAGYQIVDFVQMADAWWYRLHQA